MQEKTFSLTGPLRQRPQEIQGSPLDPATAHQDRTETAAHVGGGGRRATAEPQYCHRSPKQGRLRPGRGPLGLGEDGRSVQATSPTASVDWAGPYLPAAAAAPGGPEHSTGDPHRPTWRRGACPPSSSQLQPPPASLEGDQKQLLVSGHLLCGHCRPCRWSLLHTRDQARRFRAAGSSRVASSRPELRSEPVCRALEQSHSPCSPCLGRFPLARGPSLRSTWGSEAQLAPLL